MKSHRMSLQNRTCRKKRWSDSENRFISAHRADGYVLISEGLRALGYERSPDAVKKHAERALGIHLKLAPDGGARKCIECGRWDARPNTDAGRAGFCQACWERRKAQAYAEATDELRAKREYAREKKRRRDMLKKNNDK